MRDKAKASTMLSNNQIRILTLYPALAPVGTHAPPPPLECDIKVVTLSERPDYESLSYVRGPNTTSVSIKVAGVAVPISTTLHSALLRLRLPYRERKLWIDQLCIDQENVEEKAQQVQLMGKIYTACTQCVIWMGEIKQGVSLTAAAAVFRFFRYMRELSQADDENDVSLPSIIGDNFDSMIEALESFGKEENPWWNRIWTVQEAVLPKKLTMQWGPLKLPWKILEEATWAWGSGDTISTMLSQQEIDILGQVMVHVIWLKNSRHGNDELYALIHKWRFREATDLRDKIYGILGICKTGCLPETEMCDYKISPAEIFSTLTLELIIHEKGLRALTPYPRPTSSQVTPNIPSWALDLGSTGQADVPDGWFQIHGYECYNADNGLEQIDLDNIHAQLGRKSLSLAGIHVDTIKRVEQGYRKKSGWEFAFSKTEALLRSWYDVIMRDDTNGSPQSPSDKSKRPYPGGRYDLGEAFAKLVTGQMIRDSDSRPYRAFLEADREDVWKLMNLQGLSVDSDTRSTVYGMTANQNMFITSLGLIGLGHLDVQIGDEVWIFRGGRVPFTIRPRTATGLSGYEFIGHCYVQGVMLGEVANGDVPGIDLVERVACLW